ncbi:universal stress protein [Halobacteriales archaeon SW_5_70_135]|nr:MAG: universal stress protein [Halobacteriales archaeon SW_5_70_135]
MTDTDTNIDTDTNTDTDTDTGVGADTTAETDGYQVLVPIDQNEEHALTQAGYVADLPAASERVEAVLLHVFTPEESEEIPDELGTYKSADRIASVRRAREYLDERDVTVTLLDASGTPAAAIVEAAEDHDAAAVVVGGRKRSTAEEAVFGSVTQSVIHGTARPVVVTGDETA